MLTRLCEHLRPGGYLFLGHSESITGIDLPLTAGRQHRLPEALGQRCHAKKIRVLIVDDSASVRQTLTAGPASSDPDIEVIGAASDPFVAAQRIQEEMPDVITLDVEMPRMDGITFLRKMMAQRPIPVVMCSSLTEAGLGNADAGAGGRRGRRHPEAEDRRCRPSRRSGDRGSATRSRARRAPGVGRRRGCATARPARRPADEADRRRHAAAADAAGPWRSTTEMVVCIGASTGGTEALREVLEALPANCARHRHRPAHAGEIHRRLRPAARTACARSRSRRPRTATRCCAAMC